MPRLSSPGPFSGELGSRKGLREAVQLEEDEGGGKARGREAGRGREGVGIARLGAVEREENPRGVGVPGGGRPPRLRRRG